jgi:hypothetical protein
MIILLTLVVLWGIFSIYRIDKKCKSMGVDFDLFEGTLEEFIGGVIGGSTIIGILLYSIIKYLP